MMFNMFENGTQNKQTYLSVDENAIYELGKRTKNYQDQVDAWIIEFTQEGANV